MSTSAPSSPASKAEIRVTHRFTASAERVFDAWLDPARVGRWLFVTPTSHAVRVEVDARVGGRFVIVDRRQEEGDVEHVGTYVEIDRPRRLVFTFAVPKYSPDVDHVVVEIRPLDSGCELTLTHTFNAEWLSTEKQILNGWETILKGLATETGAA